MKSTLGMPVVGENYLSTRLYLVDRLREHVERASVLIDAPRRFGKTSVIKEFERQEKERDNFQVLFFDLEGIGSVHDFYNKCLEELIRLYWFRKHWAKIKDFTSTVVGFFSANVAKIEAYDFAVELRERTSAMKPEDLRKELEPLIQCLNSINKTTVLVFDEFPDMLLNIKNNAPSHADYVKTVDNLTAWLRTLRQSNSSQNKFQFVFCGSINIRKTLEGIGLTKRIADLESLKIPPLKENEARTLVDALFQPKGISIDHPDALTFLISKIEGGSAYYGQLIIQTLIDTGQTRLTHTHVTHAYNNMITGGSNNLSMFSERLDVYLDSIQMDCAKKVLKTLCRGAMDEQQLYNVHFSSDIDFDKFHEVVERLIFEGYLLEDPTDYGKLRFASPMLKDWWSIRRL
ncbi:MAG: ATP-binding protein [Nitrospirae bacterium]|uniref:ATP-binding protein n=1 Tax=Candidatus Magnetobacterium casense TaxID=1455061 RepID=UPI00058D4A16|nr:ATP-binding protein [Candidatus Magnetobacterium casensis]MBF0338025.1 ATP-binding protein [Nitrospirota bacterium]